MTRRERDAATKAKRDRAPWTDWNSNQRMPWARGIPTQVLSSSPLGEPLRDKQPGKHAVRKGAE